MGDVDHSWPLTEMTFHHGIKAAYCLTMPMKAKGSPMPGICLGAHGGCRSFLHHYAKRPDGLQVIITSVVPVNFTGMLLSMRDHSHPNLIQHLL